MARDCKKGNPNGPADGDVLNKGNFDSEYASLMAELGEDSGSGGGKSLGVSVTGVGSDVPPWRRPEMWQSTAPANQNAQNGYRPPQGYGGAAGYGAYGGQQYYQGGGQSMGYGGQDYSTAYAQYYQQQYSQSQAPA